MDDVDRNAESLLALVRSFGSCLIAFSGGVDSAVVASAAFRALGPQSLAVTGASASLASGELESARQLALEIGIEHRVIATGELFRVEYRRNEPDRCFHCKDELYQQLQALARERGLAVIANGANRDDLRDFRPGGLAADRWSVRSPLSECGLTKAAVRALARHWNLSAWEKPATPCLASRVAYGEQVTPDRLRQIDQAELLLKSLGFTSVRVRYHSGDLARIEVAESDLPQLTDPENRRQIVQGLGQLGFRFICLDLQGFRSGSLNVLIPSDQVVALGTRPT